MASSFARYARSASSYPVTTAFWPTERCRIFMPPDYTSFPLRKDFHLPDDAARSAGGGVGHVEKGRAPHAAPDAVRQAPA